MNIVPGDLDDPRVVATLETHARARRGAQTAAGSAHALDVDGLRAREVDLWTIWERTERLGVGALKRLSPDHGELKSMYTVLSARRLGVTGAMLRHTVSSIVRRSPTTSGTRTACS